MNMELLSLGKEHAVPDTDEFRRVLALRRRDALADVKVNDLYKRITAAFRLPTGQQELWVQQAACLAEAHDNRGLLAPLGVGEGKTLVSYLLPIVIPGVQRPTLLLPASLIEKTWDEFRELHRHWLCHPDFSVRSRFDNAVISYEKLGRDSGKDELMERRPDMLVCDEVHKLSNRQTTACTKRVERYMIANPETIFCGMSGTFTKRSIRDYWHLAYWALKRGMPLPMIEAEMELWAEALDERRIDVLSRRDPGALMLLCTDEERASVSPERTAPLGRTAQMPTFFGNLSEKLDLARKGYQRRFRETPGVVCSAEENALACSLQIRRVAFNPGPEVEQMLENLREDWVTPNGDVLPLPTDVWRVARELACGFFYEWVPPPPPEWKMARSSWNWFVREILTPPSLQNKRQRRREQGYQAAAITGEMYLRYQHLHLDSPMQVALAVQQGRIDDPNIVGAYHRWNAVKDTYKINTVPQWVSDNTINYCIEWARANKNAIIWTEHRAFGERLASLLKTGFCSNGGLDANGVPIEKYNGRTVVASVAANKEGRNLQAWNKNLIVTAAPMGSLWEQLIGRTHRNGQLADTVMVDWLAACAEQDEGFHQVMADAAYIKGTTGASQKVLYADHI